MNDSIIVGSEIQDFTPYATQRGSVLLLRPRGLVAKKRVPDIEKVEHFGEGSEL
jgi:hypothetical protein